MLDMLGLQSLWAKALKGLMVHQQRPIWARYFYLRVMGHIDLPTQVWKLDMAVISWPSYLYPSSCAGGMDHAKCRAIGPIYRYPGGSVQRRVCSTFFYHVLTMSHQEFLQICKAVIFGFETMWPWGLGIVFQVHIQFDGEVEGNNPFILHWSRKQWASWGHPVSPLQFWAGVLNQIWIIVVEQAVDIVQAVEHWGGLWNC